MQSLKKKNLNIALKLFNKPDCLLFCAGAERVCDRGHVRRIRVLCFLHN